MDYVKHGIYSLEYARGLLGAPIDNEGTVVFPSGQVLLRDLINGSASYLNQNKEKEGEDNGEKE